MKVSLIIEEHDVKDLYRYLERKIINDVPTCELLESYVWEAIKEILIGWYDPDSYLYEELDDNDINELIPIMDEVADYLLGQLGKILFGRKFVIRDLTDLDDVSKVIQVRIG